MAAVSAATLSLAALGVATVTTSVAEPTASAAARPDLGPRMQASVVEDNVRTARELAHQVQVDDAQKEAAAQAAAAKAAADKAAREKAAREKAAAQKAAADKAAREKAARERAAADAARQARERASRSQARAALSSPSAAQSIARSMVAARGWSSAQFSCLSTLWSHESGWRVTATNSSSGAYGIPQALPGSKMASAGGDWRTNARTQISWGLSYISSTYGTPCNAWSIWQTRGWY